MNLVYVHETWYICTQKLIGQNIPNVRSCLYVFNSGPLDFKSFIYMPLNSNAFLNKFLVAQPAVETHHTRIPVDLDRVNF